MDKAWQEAYGKNKEKLRCKTDLDKYFTEKEIIGVKTDTLDIGTVNFPSGEILACDPLVYLEDTKPFLQKVPAGKYPVTAAVMPSEKYGDRYACIKVAFSPNKPVVYELALTGEENDLDKIGEDEFYGFPVDAGMGCVADAKTREAYVRYWEKLSKEQNADNSFDDLFDDLLRKNAEKFPKYQSEHGDWLNWTVPDTEYNIVMFHSGWGDGLYPSYFGFDENGGLCAFYIHFIDIEAEFSDEEDEE